MGKLDVKECNRSHADQRWKDYVKKEESAMKAWRYKWGFLADEMTMAGSLSLPSTTNMEPLTLPKLKGAPQDTSHPFPKVTSSEIGWRTGRFEIYGRESRPRFTITHQLKWPHDAVR